MLKIDQVIQVILMIFPESSLAPFQGVEGIGMLAEAWRELCHMLPEMIHCAGILQSQSHITILWTCSITCSIVSICKLSYILVYLYDMPCCGTQIEFVELDLSGRNDVFRHVT